ncbi:MAG: DUF885 domain-containing protein [Sphingomonadaceae bacterium]|nr:DUF885 domain-containing protein [Sphingomonadaceae bacterium]
MPLSRRQFLSSGAVACGAALSGCAAGTPPASPSAAPSGSAGQLLHDVAEQLLSLSPETASALGIDNGARAALKGKLGDRTPAGVAAWRDMLRHNIAQLDALPASDDESMRINIDVVRTAFALGLTGMDFPYGDVAVGGWRNTPYVVAQNVGAYLDTPRLLTSDHRIENAADCDAYLSRMQEFARALDGETERLRIAATHGVIAPDFLLDKNLRQIRLQRSGDVAHWDIVETMVTHGARYGEQAASIARDAIAPALDRQIAELERHRARADDRAGVWKFADGDAYYRWALQAGTTTIRTPDEVHQMGRDQLAMLQSRMDPILRSIGYTQGSVGERMTALGHDPAYQFPDNDTGRAQIIALLEEKIADMRARMPQAFGQLVRGNVEVRRLPPAEEPGAPGAYGGPGSIDGSVPGRLWINLRSTGIWTRYSLPDLAYHEAIPGHAWQGEYSFALPLVRSILAFNAYSEGWALYAEQIADELGVYDAHPVDRLGYLQSLAFRACRLVVDTGIHAKRWTRDAAIHWFATTNGSSVDEVQGEVDRYCSWPGQACGYKVGHSEINRLRDAAQARSGNAFDRKRFNDVVVGNGNVPLTVLGRTVERHFP